MGAVARRRQLRTASRCVVSRRPTHAGRRGGRSATQAGKRPSSRPHDRVRAAHELDRCNDPARREGIGYGLAGAIRGLPELPQPRAHQGAAAAPAVPALQRSLQGRLGGLARRVRRLGAPHASVTAPRLLLDTSFAYFANTPAVYAGARAFPPAPRPATPPPRPAPSRPPPPAP